MRSTRTPGASSTRVGKDGSARPPVTPTGRSPTTPRQSHRCRSSGTLAGCGRRSCTASFARRIRGKSDEELAETFGFSGETLSHASGITRYKSVAPLIRAGDVLWMRLGGWPYSSFAIPGPTAADDPEDFMPDDWWTREEAKLELNSICAGAASVARADEIEGQRRTRLASGRHAALTRAASSLPR